MRTEKTDAKTIYFYDPAGEYGFLSNYYEAAIVFGGKYYASSEHAYQAARAVDKHIHDWLAASPTPQLAAAAGDALSPEQSKPNWRRISVPLMVDLLHAKFTQHPKLLLRLIATGESRLVEKAYGPSEANLFWSEVNGVGNNMLGNLLMDLRQSVASGACEKKENP